MLNYILGYIRDVVRKFETLLLEYISSLVANIWQRDVLSMVGSQYAIFHINMLFVDVANNIFISSNSFLFWDENCAGIKARATLVKTDIVNVSRAICTTAVLDFV